MNIAKEMTLKIDISTHRKLKAYSRESGIFMKTYIDKAIEFYHRAEQQKKERGVDMKSNYKTLFKLGSFFIAKYIPDEAYRTGVFLARNLGNYYEVIFEIGTRIEKKVVDK
jgi:hypothetical protein